MMLRKIWWTIISAYILLVYATLSVVSVMWEQIDGLLGGKGPVVVMLLVLLAAILVLVHMVFVKKEKGAKEYLLFLLFLWVYLALWKIAKMPAEKVHLIEYSILGVMVYNALKIDIDSYKWKLYIFGGVFCIVIALIDEVIQGILPNRVFDFRDIFINVMSSLTALMVIRFNVLKEEPKSFTSQGD
ncbi:VanZ family protein [Candidatus Omnitrophota bacterium]